MMAWLRAIDGGQTALFSWCFINNKWFSKINNINVISKALKIIRKKTKTYKKVNTIKYNILNVCV